MHASQYLKSPANHCPGALVGIFGAERYLRHEAQRAVVNAVLGDGDERDASLTRVAGKEAELRSVCDELRTTSMWGDARVVIVEDADEFVSDNRSGLKKPSSSQTLLQVRVFGLRMQKRREADLSAFRVNRRAAESCGR